MIGRTIDLYHAQVTLLSIDPEHCSFEVTILEKSNATPGAVAVGGEFEVTPVSDTEGCYAGMYPVRKNGWACDCVLYAAPICCPAILFAVCELVQDAYLAMGVQPAVIS